MMEHVDVSEMLRRGVRETAAADLGVDPAELEHLPEEQPTVTTYKTDKAGYRHWEIRRITYPGGTPDYYEHRDKQAQGNWLGGCPRG